MKAVPRQPSLFETPVVLDAHEGDVLAADGQDRSDRTTLRAQYDQACHDACSRYPLLCADQVWEARGTIPNSKGAASGLGPAMKRAVRAGWMVPTGDFRLSERPVAHRKPLPLYRSLIHHAAGRIAHA